MSRAVASVDVFDNDVEAALKFLKKKLTKSGFFGELKSRAHHLKRGDRKRLKSKKARSKLKKAAAKRLEYDRDHKPFANGASA